MYQRISSDYSLWSVLYWIFVAALLFRPETAIAQNKNEFGSSFRNRPAVSPYLSMIDNGSGNGALNYFNIVKPQQRARNTTRRLQNEINQLEANNPNKVPAPNAATGGGLRAVTSGRMQPSGHPTSYGNTGNYFGGAANRNTAAFNSYGRNGRN